MKIVHHAAVLLLSISLLASCSSSFVYNRLDWLIPLWLDDYVDLSQEQREALDNQLAPLLQWHRQEELVRYQQLIEQLEAHLQNPVTVNQVQNWTEELVQATQRIEQSMLELALGFGASLSDQQIEEFIDNLNEEQGKDEREFLSRSEDEYVQENFENLEGLLKRLMGRLDSEQKTRLHDAAAAMQRFDAVWLEERRQWLDKLEPLLARDVGWQESVRRAQQNRRNNRPAAYSEIFEHNMNVINQALADVLNSRTAQQMERTSQQLNELRNKLQTMMDQP